VVLFPVFTAVFFCIQASRGLRVNGVWREQHTIHPRLTNFMSEIHGDEVLLVTEDSGNVPGFDIGQT
jgi:hypothetical protein